MQGLTLARTEAEAAVSARGPVVSDTAEPEPEPEPRVSSLAPVPEPDAVIGAAEPGAAPDESGAAEAGAENTPVVYPRLDEEALL